MRAYVPSADCSGHCTLAVGAMLISGARLAGYRIERILGEGGMGAVYLAAHPTLPRRDAVKVLSGELSRDPDFRARFLREADVASSLQHPNVVSIYDRGQAETGELWIAMEFVDGTDAEDALRTGTMTPQRAVHIVAEVAKALDYAHSRGIVHRDVKPANFLLSGPPGLSERVLLGDFGIARALDDYGLTATGSLLATVAYAAPEVLSGEPFDGRADIYSLGCTLYRLLTGSTPFLATNGMAAVMMAHLQQPPPRVTATAPSLPPALDQVIAIAMAKQPAARFSTATALADAAFEALADPHNGILPPLQPVSRADVTSYPPTPVSAEPAWWQLSGARTQLGPRTSTPTPEQEATARSRQRGRILAAGGVAVCAAALAAVAVIAWPERTAPAEPPVGSPPPSAPPPSAPTTSIGSASTPPSPQRPATNVAAPALRSILLPAAQINQIIGATMVLDGDSGSITPGTDLIGDPQCQSVWEPAQPAAFEGDSTFPNTTATGVAEQSLRALNAQPWQDGMTQAAISLPSMGAVSLFMQLQVQRWAGCASASPVTITAAPSAPQAWTFTQPITSAGILTLSVTTNGGACKRGLAARGNVILDVRLCRTSGDNDVTALINAMAERVPIQ